MIRMAALLLTVLTGFSGLVYEVTWEKYLATLLGSHSEATSALLGLYLGGLAIGYSAFGRVATRVVSRARSRGRTPRLIAVYGALEAGIGVWALLFAWLFRGAQALSLFVPHGNSGLGFAFDVALCGLLVLPPAILMGGTIPMLTQALARGLEDATRFHALVYAFNTAGAFFGALAAGFWLVPTLGLVRTCLAMGAINIGAGLLFLWIGTRRGAADLSRRQTEATSGSPGTVAPPADAVAGFALFAAVALLGGFAMMAIQTVLIRLGGLSFGASQFTFSMVVAVFVLCISLGSFAVSALDRIPRWVLVANLWGLFGVFAFLYLRLPDAPYWAHALRALFRDNPSGFHPYYASAFLGVLSVIGLPVTLSGATLPLIFHHLRGEVGDLGNAAGRLYSWNTLGSLLGALLGGYVLLFWLDLDQVFQIALAALGGSALLATLRVTRVRPMRTGALLLVSSLVLVALLPRWEQQQMMAGLFRVREPEPHTFSGPEVFWRERSERRLRFYSDGPSASIAVVETRINGDAMARSIVTNGKSDSNTTGDYPTMALLGLLPALFAERAERAFVIGYGAGGTVGELASLGSMREVVVAEISKGVIDAAPWFDFSNRQASKSPQVRIVRGDAYRTLLRSDDRYDVIVSEPSNPWVIGVEMLYSREFLEAARDRLTPGGVFVQWMHTYEIDDASVALVMRTYADVFDKVAVWYGMETDFLLLGFSDASRALDVERLGERAGRPDFRAGLERAGVVGFPALLAHEILPLGVMQATPLRGPRHTLLHPRLSYSAARGFYTGGSAGLPSTLSPRAAEVGRRNALLGLYREARGGNLSEDDWNGVIRETCRYHPNLCTTLLASWKAETPKSPARRRIVRELRESTDSTVHVDFSAIPRLVRLFGGEPDNAAGEGSKLPNSADDPLEIARRVSNDFVENYHHAAPFSRRVLEEVWTKCEAADDLLDRCITSRAKLQRTLGRLEVGGS